MQGNQLAELRHGMYTEPLSESCRRILERGEHALVGVSAGNSYFDQERLTALLEWTRRTFAGVDVVYVDTHIDTMLVADGRTPEYAARSARSTVKDVRRRIRRAVERVDPDGLRIRVRALSELLDTPEYREVRRRTDRALAEDAGFAATCEEMVGQVLQHRMGPGSGATTAHWEAGLGYVRAEAPLFVDAPAVFNVPSSMVCYHMNTPISAHLVQPDSTFRAAPGHGYVIVRPSTPDC